LKEGIDMNQWDPCECELESEPIGSVSGTDKPAEPEPQPQCAALEQELFDAETQLKATTRLANILLAVTLAVLVAAVAFAVLFTACNNTTPAGGEETTVVTTTETVQSTIAIAT
jgi:hypothetical protein